MNRREGILSKDKTPADSLEALVDAFEPHRLLAEAGEHNVEATDAFANMRLGEARDEAFLAHLPSTYDLARRGGKILKDRQDALDAANAKKARDYRRETRFVAARLGRRARSSGMVAATSTASSTRRRARPGRSH